VCKAEEKSRERPRIRASGVCSAAKKRAGKSENVTHKGESPRMQLRPSVRAHRGARPARASWNKWPGQCGDHGCMACVHGGVLRPHTSCRHGQHGLACGESSLGGPNASSAASPSQQNSAARARLTHLCCLPLLSRARVRRSWFVHVRTKPEGSTPVKWRRTSSTAVRLHGVHTVWGWL